MTKRKFEYLARRKVKRINFKYLCDTCNKKYSIKQIIKFPAQDSNGNDAVFQLCINCTNQFIRTQCKKTRVCWLQKKDCLNCHCVYAAKARLAIQQGS